VIEGAYRFGPGGKREKRKCAASEEIFLRQKGREGKGVIEERQKPQRAGKNYIEEGSLGKIRLWRIEILLGKG